MTIDWRAIVGDPARLRSALEAADVAPLTMVLVQLSGEEEWLERLRPSVKGPWDFHVHAPAELERAVRERLAAVLNDYAAHDRPLPAPPDEALLLRMMSVAVGEEVGGDYASMVLEELAIDQPDTRAVPWRARPDQARLDAFNVVVIGAGMSGLCAAIRLREAGLPFTIVEKNDAVGGTWYENGYPGCGVDTLNHFYSYSFEPNHGWSRFFSKRDELWAYFERCADRYDLRRCIRFRTEVEAAEWDEAAGRWRVRTRGADGRRETLEASAVISAVGQLNRPAIPRIDGLDGFRGRVVHTGAWDPALDLRGKRVAMIGTGASGMQVAPEIAPEVEKLTIFQRTPHWSVPNPNYHREVSEGKKWVLAHVPFYARWYRFQLFWAFADGIHPALQKDPEWHEPARSLNAMSERFRRNMVRHIRKELEGDEDLIAKCVPSYPPYGKRMLIDNHWYKTLKRPNVELVTGPVRRVEPDAVIGSDGVRREADVIVLATGFQAARMLAPMEVRGRGGVSLRELWGEDDPRAHLGVTAPGFPNFFMLYGPNTNLGHGGSIIFHTECQVRLVMQMLRELLESGRRTIECRREAHDRYNAAVDAAHERMVWSHPGMNTWYRNSKGRVITNSPWRLRDYWAMTRELKLDDYEVA